MATYGNDLEYLSGKGLEIIELCDGDSRLMIVPAWQGRVVTSTTGGCDAPGFGWVNRRFIDSGVVSRKFNPFGGEERFWIGPEGGPFSWYFAPGAEQTFDNWTVPAGIDTEAFKILSRNGREAVFGKELHWTNASGFEFHMDVRRKVELVGRKELSTVLGLELPEGVSALAYRTENTLTNAGSGSWTKETGLPSVWLLGSFNPTPTTTVFIPYRKDCVGRTVNDEYFGKVPSDRLVVDDGVVYFRIDGNFRSKIGLPDGSAKDVCGSYDSAGKVLNILKYTVPDGEKDYVNGQWGPQDNPFGGDVINSYNDGPNDSGSVMGPFYEIETSSPGAALSPGESLTHTQYTIHITGSEDGLDLISRKVFGLSLGKISSVFA